MQQLVFSFYRISELEEELRAEQEDRYFHDLYMEQSMLLDREEWEAQVYADSHITHCPCCSHKVPATTPTVPLPNYAHILAQPYPSISYTQQIVPNTLYPQTTSYPQYSGGITTSIPPYQGNAGLNNQLILDQYLSSYDSLKKLPGDLIQYGGVKGYVSPPFDIPASGDEEESK